MSDICDCGGVNWQHPPSPSWALAGLTPSRFTYHCEDGHPFQPTAEDTWVCAVCGDEVGDHEERPVAKNAPSSDDLWYRAHPTWPCASDYAKPVVTLPITKRTEP